MSDAAWYPGIERACSHWRDAPMLQQTYEAMAQAFGEDNDAAIDAAKCVVEVVCQIIVDEFHSAATPCRPQGANPSLSEWLSSAVRVLKLGEVRDAEFQKLVSSHHKLADALNGLRNKGGPVSHGKEAYLQRLTAHHRRSAVLAADAIVAFLFDAFVDESVNLALTREPYERFRAWNELIDAHVSVLEAEADVDGWLRVEIGLPDRTTLPLELSPSELLYQVDREAYKTALAAAQSAEAAKPVEGVAR